VRAGIACTIVILVMVSPAAAQQSTPATSPKTMMSKTELASFFRTLDLNLPLWRITVLNADPVNLKMSYANGKFMEMSRDDFLAACDYLDKGLPVLLINPSLKDQIAVVGTFERMKADIEQVIILYALNGDPRGNWQSVMDQVARTGQELAASDMRLASHLSALAGKLDSLIDVETLLP
jgi:hypothetical protein